MRYRYFNFAIESDVPLDGLAASCDRPCLTLVRDSQPERSSGTAWFHALVRHDGQTWLRVGRTGGDLVIDICGSALLRVEGDLVWWHRDHGVDESGFRHLLLDQALPLLAARRGLTILHAACLALDGRGVLLAGPSGSGKSTIAAAFAQRSGAIVGDDTAALFTQGGTVLAQPAYAGVRLWPDAIAALGERGGQLVANGTSKRRVQTGGPASACTVAAIYVLERAAADRPRVAELSGRQALMALVRNALVLDPSDRARSADHLARLAAIASRVRVRTFEIPHRFGALPDAVSLLASELQPESVL